MKKRLTALLAIVACSAATALAQGVEERWTTYRVGDNENYAVVRVLVKKDAFCRNLPAGQNCNQRWSETLPADTPLGKDEVRYYSAYPIGILKTTIDKNNFCGIRKWIQPFNLRDCEDDWREFTQSAAAMK